MKIGIYGGTFNPPHLGHMTSCREAVAALGLDKIILIPTGTPPHKEVEPGSPTGWERLEMTRLAVDSLLLSGKAEVDDLELRREGRSYTADTVRELHERYPDDRLFLLMGSDMLLSFHTWYHPEEICAHAHLCAFARSGEDCQADLEAQAERLRRELGAEVTVLKLPQVVDISSTQLRQSFREGQGREYLPLSVYGYILRRGLYGVPAQLKDLSDDDLRACSLSMVYAKRHAHILGVEETAVELARKWGADPVLARRAGILHDCTKYLTPQEHFDLCAAAGVEVDPLERDNPKLLHAKTGAILARDLYGQPREVYDAIYWHTTGREGMALLEKILYVADYMEPNRDFDGVDEMRRLAWSDLDGALLMGLQMAIDDLKERKLIIHHNTQEAYDWLIQQRKGH